MVTFGHRNAKGDHFCIFEEADNATTFSGFQPFFYKPLSFVRIIYNGVPYFIENI